MEQAPGSPTVVMAGTQDDAWFWLLTRGPFTAFLGLGLAFTPGDRVVGVLGGLFMPGYVVVWFLYLILLPARVHYTFTEDRVRAWRRGRLVKSIEVADIDETFGSWWESSEWGMLPGLWPWPPRFGCTLRNGAEVILPTVLHDETEGEDLIAQISNVTGLRFHSSLTGEYVTPGG